MRERLRVWGLGLWAAAVVGLLAVTIARPFPGHESDWPWVAGQMFFPVAASLLLIRQPGNPIGRLLALAGGASGVIFTLSWLVVAFPEQSFGPYVEPLESAAVVVQFAALLALLHLFPTGRALPGIHSRIITALWWWAVVSALLVIVRPGPLPVTGTPNPFGLGPLWLGGVFDASLAGLPVFALLGLGAVILRRRRATPVERAQLKWFFVAAAMVLFTFVVIVFFPGDFTNPVANQLSYVFVVIALWSLPIAVVIAITRYRLFEIHRLVSRTVSYAVVGAILVVVYAGTVVGLQAVLPVAGSDLAVAGSTLAAAATFNPLRRRVQAAVDRRFNRKGYQQEVVTQRFAQSLRQQVDLDTVAGNLREVVRETVQPVRVGVWLQQGSA